MNAFKSHVMYGILAVCMMLGLVGIVIGATSSKEVESKTLASNVTEAPSVSISITPTEGIQIFASTNGYVIEATPVVLDAKDIVVKEPTAAPEEDVEETVPTIEGKVSIIADPTYIFNQASSSEPAIAIAHAGEAYEWISAYSTEAWAAISYEGGVAFVSMDCVEVDGLADHSSDVFTAGVGGMSIVPVEEEEVFITPLPTATPTPTPSPTNTPTPLPTNTPTPAPTNTPVPQQPQHSGATFVPQEGQGGSTPATVSDEILLTCLVATESGSLYEERLAVASVVVNICNKTGKSMFQVISAPNQFSVYAGGQLQRAINNYVSGANTYPECHKAAMEVLTKGPTVKWTNFWAWWYQQTRPNFQTDGEKIGATWFFDWH